MTETTSINMAEIYRFLAQSMRYPVLDWMTADYFSVLDSFLAELGWDAEAQALRRSISEKADWLEPLQVEHTRLFVNAIPAVVAPPYGSVYLSADGMLYGPSAEKAKAFYREQGFDLAGEADIPDHITFELEFLALLAQEGKSQEEEVFLQRHFRPWFPSFQARVIKEVRHPFYRVLVNLIDFFTREEL
ncbi:MAG: molecular chaperone TorD family protein [Desulfobulbaceae bacterium]|nr:molecular chaperone TorD family protein [Desulfobulbaceae bacterium]